MSLIIDSFKFASGYPTPSVDYQARQQGPGASQITFTPATAPTAGKLVVVFARASNQASSTITATGWTRGSELGGATTPAWVMFYRRVLAGPDFSSIVVDYSATPGNYDLVWFECSGTDLVEDQAVTTASGASTQSTTGIPTQTPTITHVLALTLVVFNGATSNHSSDQGFTQSAIGTGATDRLATGYKVITDGSATGAPVVSWTTNRNYQAAMVLLRAGN